MIAKIYNLVTNEVTTYENVVSVESLPSDKNSIILTLPDNKFRIIDISGKKQFIISWFCPLQKINNKVICIWNLTWLPL